MNTRNIIINSTIMFVSATTIQGIIHELGHFIAAVLLHSSDVTLYHNYVQHDSSQLAQNSRLAIAAAGPLISLLTGIVFYLVCRKTEHPKFITLFYIYMSAFGFINFGGYLLVSPFFEGGDTGYIFKQLGFPLWLTIVMALIGVVFLFYSIKMLCPYFVQLAPTSIISDKEARRKFINALIKSSVFYGIIITAITEFPIPVFLSVLYPICSPFTFFWVYGYLLDSEYKTFESTASYNELNSGIPKFGIALFLGCIIINRLLVYGISW